MFVYSGMVTDVLLIVTEGGCAGMEASMVKAVDSPQGEYDP